jgi:Skp family chaperone for outer membrane proteins
MKKLLSVLALGVCAMSAMAQTAAMPAAAPASAAASGVTRCVSEADAKALKGAERKTFMQECRANRKEKHAKHEACVAEANQQNLKGADAKKAIHACMTK